MSRTFTAANGTRFHYNSDMSGGVRLERDNIKINGVSGAFSVSVPPMDLLEFAAEIIKQNQLAKLEGQTWHEIIGGLE